MLVHGPRLGRALGLEVQILALRRHGGSVDERDDLVQHADIPGDADIVRDGERQEQPVVGEARADAASRWRVPPMLHVAFLELMAARAHEVRARLLGGGDRERHHVLELVAKSVRAARLVETGAREQATRPHLVDDLPLGTDERLEVDEPRPTQQR